jgi:hypothetical protein
MDCFLEGGREAGDIGPGMGAEVFFVLFGGRGMPVLFGLFGLLVLIDGVFGFARGGAAMEC